MAATKVTPWVKSTCAYCGVGCGIEARPTANGQLEVRGDKDHPANSGRLCSKGLALGETVIHDGRLRHPFIHGVRSDWNTALSHVANQFSDIIAEHGPDAVAFYASGQLLTEDYYVANKLMKGFIGSANIDTNSRLCMSSSVAGHKRAFGSDTVPGCYEDLELADMIVITGSNLAWCHPVLYQRIKAAKQQRPELNVVVIDPRVTDTCEIADLHLPIHPGSDVALFNGLLNYLDQTDNINQSYIDTHTEGFIPALIHAREGAAALPQKTGISEDKLTAFYKAFATTEKVVTIYSQGVNQSTQGTDKVNSILNCHLATGRIGQPGSGPFSVTGQPNAMGGREVGGLASTLAAHMEFGNKQHHQLISDYWQTDNLATQPGLRAIELFDAIDEGKIKAVWIMATNPVVSLPDADKIKRALEKCSLVVVSDCIADTDTTRCADVVLPAQGWSEKSGTVTNSERRISRQRRLLPTPGEGKPDWWIISEVAKKMGFTKAFDYLHEAEIFDEYVKMTGLGNDSNKNNTQRDLNLTGLADLSVGQYAQLTPQQWPVLKREEQITHKRMFHNGHFFTPSGKAQFIAVQHHSPAIQCSEEHPLTLNSGRIRDQWHTMTRTGLSARLGAHLPEPFISVHPDDAQRYGLENGKIATVCSAWGSAQARVDVSTKVSIGQLFMPIHWNNITSSAGKVCSLISPETDRLSGQPEYKYTPVSITPFVYKSEAMLLSNTILDITEFDYWVRQKVTGGYLYRIASDLLPEQLMLQLSGYCQHEKGRELSFNGSGKGQYRYASIEQQRLRSCYLVAHNLQQQDLEWLQNLLDEPIDDTVERSLISGTAEGKLAAGKTVCACKQVGKNTICQAIREQNLNSVEQISACTGAGTGCGSCEPELQLILDEQLIESA
ncbi:molybdopterin-dependent oxidoreductase [Photobacterium sagamiensis]|uniref:molybdopterin-dependent oxidoreductase n=1 Tax=Photobacterium sagamiensis TaxID=2910241 RepID=UPI003D138D75